MTETEHIHKDKAARKEAQTIPTAREEHRSGLLCGETDYRNTHLNQTFRTRTNSENTNTPTTEKYEGTGEDRDSRKRNQTKEKASNTAEIGEKLHHHVETWK